jgi:hypothetical protein
MAVENGFGLGHGLEDFKMQQQFAGAGASAGKLVAVEIDQANVLGRQVEFADESRRTQNFVGADAIGDVAAVAVDKLAQPELAAGCADFPLDFFGLG